MRLTKTQVDGLKMLRDNGRPTEFGGGFGRIRVALRALHLRSPELLEYLPDSCERNETFTITDKGLLAISTL